MAARAGTEYLVGLAVKQKIDDATKNAKEKNIMGNRNVPKY